MATKKTTVSDGQLIADAILELAAVVKGLLVVDRPDLGNAAEAVVEADPVKDAVSKKPPVKKTKKAEPDFTKDQVRDALRKVNAVESSAVGRKIVADHGGTTLTDLDPAVYGKVITQCREICEGAG
jgi:hypothetical protein